MALLGKAGDVVIVGQSKGSFLAVLDAASLNTLELIKLPHCARVLGLTLDRKGKLLLVNCHDRAIRMFELQPAAAESQRGCDAAQIARLLEDEVKVSSGASPWHRLAWK